MKTVLIVDDHPVARLAIRILLEKDDMTIVGETADGHEAIQLAKTLSPDLIMIDIDIPSLNGIDVMQRLRKNNYTGGLLVLSARMMTITFVAVQVSVPVVLLANAIT